MSLASNALAGFVRVGAEIKSVRAVLANKAEVVEIAANATEVPVSAPLTAIVIRLKQ